MRRHHDLFQIRRGAGQPYAVDDQLISALLDITAPGILVVLYDRRMDLTQGEYKARQSIGIDEHFILLREATQGIDIRESRNGPQHRTDHPVLEGPQLSQGLCRALDEIHEYFTESRTDRSQHRLGALWKPGSHLEHPFQDELPGKIDIHSILKDHRNHRKPEPRN